MNNKILTAGGISLLFILSFLMLPLGATGGLMGEPSVVLSPIYIDDLSTTAYGSNSMANDFEQMVMIGIQSAQVQEMINNLYSSRTTFGDVHVPMNWYVIPHLLLGVEEKDLTYDVLQKVSSIAVIKTVSEITNEDGTSDFIEEYKLQNLNIYLRELVKIIPYSKGKGLDINILSTWVEGLSNVYHHEGLDKELLESLNMELIYPLNEKARVTSEFGLYDPFNTGKPTFHYALDLAFSDAENTCGKPVFASHDGVVILKGSDPSDSRGFFVNISKDGFESRYYHFSASSPVRVNDTIKQGDFIGTIGTTGKSTGCHLHFELARGSRYINPRDLLDFDNPIIGIR